MNRQMRRALEKGLEKIKPMVGKVGAGRIGAIMGEVERRLAADGKAAPDGLLDKIAGELESSAKRPKG